MKSVDGNSRIDLDDRPAAAAAGDGLEEPSLYLNRELSWLDFNDRVLQLAEDERLPLLERVKFCAIYTTNLDEYYMVRVAGLHDQIEAGVEYPGPDGRTPSETIGLIRERALAQSRRLTRASKGSCAPRSPSTGSAWWVSATSTRSAAPSSTGTSRRRSSPRSRRSR